jgi:hypothetical protein
MQSSRRAFMSLIKYFRNIENDLIKEIVCDDLYSELEMQIMQGTLTPKNSLLVVKIKKAVAYLGLAEAIPHHRLVISSDGFTFNSSGDGFDDKRNTTNSQHSDAINGLLHKCNEMGGKYLAEISTYLKQNADIYPLWRDSNCNKKKQINSHSIVVSKDGIGGIGFF